MSSIRRKRRRMLNRLVDASMQIQSHDSDQDIVSRPSNSSDEDNVGECDPPQMDNIQIVEVHVPYVREEQMNAVPANHNLPIIPFSNQQSKESDDENYDQDSISSHTSYESSNGGDIFTDLRNVFVSINITNQDLSKVLRVLHKYHPELPVDARTLLSTKPEKIQVKDVHPGSYYHFGLEKGLRFIVRYLKLDETVIRLQFNVDGLPIHKDSFCSFWPILCMIVGYPASVFLVGVYCGDAKPDRAEDYLSDFINELHVLLTHGLSVVGLHVIDIQLHSFCCDTPARHFLLNVKPHGAYYGCERCYQKGITIDNRRVFLEVDSMKRDNASFRSKSQPQHHKGSSALEVIGILDMVEQFPLDYMHNVCKGLVVKLLEELRSGDKERLSSKLLHDLSKYLCSLRSDIPSDFNRRPRSIFHLGKWKATELRLFLLYLSPIVLPKFCSERYAHCFTTLCVIMRLYCSNCKEEYLQYARLLTVKVIEEMKIMFGERFLVYNTHSIVHLFDDVKKFGSLDAFSCFVFENFLRFVKRSVRGTKLPLQQLVKRVSESDQTLGHSHTTVKRVDDLQKEFFPTTDIIPKECGDGNRYYKKLLNNESVLEANTPNQYIFLKGNPPIPFKIAFFAEKKDHPIRIIGWPIKSIGNVFNHPLPSDRVGFLKVNIDCLSQVKLVKLCDVQRKAMLLSNKYFISMLHS